MTSSTEVRGIAREGSAPRGFYEFARLHPDKAALVVPGRSTTTFGELLERVDAISYGIRALGLSRGDVVAMVVGNGTEYFELSLATAQIGVYVVPINWHLAPREIAFILQDSGAQIVVADVDHVEPLPADSLPDHRFVVGGEADGWLSYPELYRDQPTCEVPDRVAGTVMGYTSGTTGNPKGVRTSIPAIEPEAFIEAGLKPFFGVYGASTEDGVHLVCSPLYHAAPGGHALGFLHFGHTVVIDQGFDAERFLTLVEEHRVTTSHMVPTQFHRLLRLPRTVRDGYDLSSLQALIHAGAPCPVETKKQMLDWVGPVIWEYLGSTEGTVSRVSPQEALAKPGTVGRIIDGVVVKIITDDGEEAAAGEAGTIYFGREGQPVSFEYHGDPNKTAASRRGNLATVGDLGYFDEDGYLFLLDRRSDLIISGGVNIYPAEIEQHLIGHPAVADVAVIGVPDEEWGHSVLAVIEASPGFEGSADLEAELKAYAREGLAGFKVPRRFEFLSNFPRTESGKLQRRKIRDQFVSTSRF